MSDKLMDTAPGGENTQYESIKTVTKDPERDQGQLGATATASTDEVEKQLKSAEGEHQAENIRYGQNISEFGVGGFTGGLGGNGDGAKAGEDQAQNTREAQGYSGGSGVGA